MLEGGIVWQSQQLWELTGAAFWTRIWTAQGAGGAAGRALEVCTAAGSTHADAAVKVKAVAHRELALRAGRKANKPPSRFTPKYVGGSVCQLYIDVWFMPSS